MSTKTATIETNSRGEIVAWDADGNLIAMKRRAYNPAALAQLIADVEGDGYTIDWVNFTVAKPETEPVLPVQAAGERPARYVNQITEMGATYPLSRSIRVF